jgi:hypothetical protein
MTRPATRTLSMMLVVALAAGALLIAPARAAAGPNGSGRTGAPASPGLDRGELRRLLHQIVAAGAPGAAARVREEFSTPAVSEAFNQVFMTLAMGLLDGAASGVASTSASLRAAVRAGMTVRAEQ